MILNFEVLIHPTEEGGFWAEIPALPGCVSQGETQVDVIANLQEAADGWLSMALCLPE